MHPEFFEEYADMLAEIQVPHPHGGRAIPISERQIVALRDKNRILQDKLAELIRFGEENGAITEKMHRLAVALLTFTHLADFLHGLNFHLREDFSIPHMALRLWNMTADGTALPEFTPTGADIRALTESLRALTAVLTYWTRSEAGSEKMLFACAHLRWCPCQQSKPSVCW